MPMLGKRQFFSWRQWIRPRGNATKFRSLESRCSFLTTSRQSTNFWPLNCFLTTLFAPYCTHASPAFAFSSICTFCPAPAYIQPVLVLQASLLSCISLLLPSIHSYCPTVSLLKPSWIASIQSCIPFASCAWPVVVMTCICLHSSFPVRSKFENFWINKND